MRLKLVDVSGKELGFGFGALSGNESDAEI